MAENTMADHTEASHTSFRGGLSEMKQQNPDLWKGVARSLTATYTPREVEKKPFELKDLRHFDMFGYDPTYRWTNFTSWVGASLSLLTVTLLLFYIGVTLRDFLWELPELNQKETQSLPDVAGQVVYPGPNQIGFSMEYEIGGEDYKLDEYNRDRYFRYSWNHVTIREQDSLPRTYLTAPTITCEIAGQEQICIDPGFLENVELEGTYVKPVYQYLQLTIEKCIKDEDDKDDDCASMDEINKAIASGDTKYSLALEVENFDVADFDADGSGIYPATMGWRWYPLPNAEIKNEIYLLPRLILDEHKILGSPPMAEGERKLLDFERIETVIQPQPLDSEEVASFYIRLRDSVQVEELDYWTQSLLDLFGLWGAMSSFLTVLSFGFIGATYNRWRFKSNFRNKTKNALKQKNMKASGFVPHMKILEQMVVDDIRLFDKHHFDDYGRLCLSVEEIKHPVTAFGELRTLALKEHSKKIFAAQTISRWYKEMKKEKTSEDTASLDGSGEGQPKKRKSSINLQPTRSSWSSAF